MKSVLRRVGYVVGGLLVIVVLGVGVVWAIVGSRMGRTYPTDVTAVSVPTDSAAIARGRHLATAVGKCADCHGENLAGAVVMDAPVFVNLTSSNLTSGKGGIASSYTDVDWTRAIRHGIGRNGKPLIFMPSEAYTHFSDADLGALIAYLKTLPPADLSVEPARSIGPAGRFAYLFGGFPLIPAELIDESRQRSNAVTPGVTVEYGRYLSEAGGCTGCHAPSLGGGMKIGNAISANLTRGGHMASWSEADFFRAIRNGTRPDGTKISEEMPWKAMGALSDDELRATWMYIQSMPPVTTQPK